RGGAAHGDLRRHGHPARAHRRRRPRGGDEERGERLRRALELRPRRHLRRHRGLHARGLRPGYRPPLALGGERLAAPHGSRPRPAGRGRPVSELALDVRGLEKSFGGLRVTDGVSLAVAPGERRLIIGPNGAGKTTLFNLITGELRPDGGSIALFGRDITRVPGRRRPHLGIARTYQIITLFPRETLGHNVTLALLGLRRLRWNPLVRLERQAGLRALAQQALARVRLDHLAERPPAQTSYGELRRA